MDSVVACIGEVGVNQPEGVKGGSEERFLGGYIEGEDVIHPLEPWEHRKRSKERHVNIGRHARLADRGEKGLKAVERGKVSLVNKRVLKENYGGVGCRFAERLKKARKASQLPRQLC